MKMTQNRPGKGAGQLVLIHEKICDAEALSGVLDFICRCVLSQTWRASLASERPPIMKCFHLPLRSEWPLTLMSQ